MAAEEQTKQKKSIFENPVMRTRIKSANVNIITEGGLGYLIGPTLALLSNSIMTNYFNRYMTDVMDGFNWSAGASAFFTWLPVVSVIFVILGNILVGRLMDHNRTVAGKARPLILLGIPLMIVALLVIFVITPLANWDSAGGQVAAMIIIAIGYNLWYAIAYPMYYTPHAALVSLSTRNSSHRSLLGTLSNACTLAAMGITSMILPYFINLLFVPEYQMDAATGKYVLGETGKKISIGVDGTKSSQHWMIFVIVLMVLILVGVLLEFYFTRERVTEESFTGKQMMGQMKPKKAASVGKQAKVCLTDKFWWIMMVFYLCYQFGGMAKNVSISYFCSSWFVDSAGNYTLTNGGTWMGTISIIGAIPTVVGMFLAWPISNRIGKGKTILIGAALAAVGGAIGFINPASEALVITSFVIKALGSTPAMYLSLALLADVMDHEEAKHGFRTDGFTMTVYGAIMAGMTGIATGVLNIILSSVGYSSTNLGSSSLQTGVLWMFIGVETICYAVIFLMFFFMNVEKNIRRDHKIITARQQAEAEAEGIEWIPPAEKMRIEQEQANVEAEEARKEELRVKCEKEGKNFEEEEAKFEADRAEKQRIKEEKEAQRKQQKEEAAAKAEEDRIEKLRAKCEAEGLDFDDEEAMYQAELAEKARLKEEKKALRLQKQEEADRAIDKLEKEDDARRDAKMREKIRIRCEAESAKYAQNKDKIEAQIKARCDAKAAKYEQNKEAIEAKLMAKCEKRELDYSEELDEYLDSFNYAVQLQKYRDSVDYDAQIAEYEASLPIAVDIYPDEDIPAEEPLSASGRTDILQEVEYGTSQGDGGIEDIPTEETAEEPAEIEEEAPSEESPDEKKEE